MVPEDFEALSERRVGRARELAARHVASREVLEFYAELAAFQIAVLPRIRAAEALSELREALVEVVSVHGPEQLRQAVRRLDDSRLRAALETYREQPERPTADSFFARVLLQPWAATADLEAFAPRADRCPRCAQRPQAGTLRREGHGAALHLSCSLCFGEWPFPRGRCAACGESGADRLSYYAADPDHLQLQACETCRVYLHVVDLEKDPAAIADVDELVALPLDLWARENGYRKLQMNLAGI